MKALLHIPAWFKRLLYSPTGELTRWQRAARFSIDLGWHCTKELKHDRAAEMAAALTYRTIFSLIPVLVLSLVVFNAFDGFEKLRDKAQKDALEYFGLNTLQYQEDVESFTPTVARFFGMTGPPVPVVTKEAMNAKDAVDNRALVTETIDELVKSVEKLNFESISAVGFILLIWAALAMAIAMEHSFNQIYGAAEGRSWFRRISVYWSALTLGPVLLLLSVYMTTQVVSQASELPILGTLVNFMGRFTALVASWLLLLFLYILMPNTSVHFRPAVIGALVAAVLWEGAKAAFGLYVQEVAFTKLYGTLGLIPLFLFWIYVTWLIILFGLEVTYTLQAMKGRRFKHEARKQADDNVIDSMWLLPLAARIAEAFDQGKQCQTTDLASSMSLPLRSITKMTLALERAGIIHRVTEQDEKEFITLARPAQRIPLDQVVAAADYLLPKRLASQNGNPAWKVVKDIQASGREKLREQTLANLIEQPSSEAEISA